MLGDALSQPGRLITHQLIVDSSLCASVRDAFPVVVLDWRLGNLTEQDREAIGGDCIVLSANAEVIDHLIRNRDRRIWERSTH